jgi:hypothetical protein
MRSIRRGHLLTSTRMTAELEATEGVAPNRACAGRPVRAPLIRAVRAWPAPAPAHGQRHESASSSQDVRSWLRKAWTVEGPATLDAQSPTAPLSMSDQRCAPGSGGAELVGPRPCLIRAGRLAVWRPRAGLPPAISRSASISNSLSAKIRLSPPILLPGIGAHEGR